MWVTKNLSQYCKSLFNYQSFLRVSRWSTFFPKFMEASPRAAERGAGGQFAPEPQGLRGLIIEDL